MGVSSAITIGNVTLPNRFMRSATWEGMAAADGSVTPRLLDYMRPLANGGLGLLITSHMYVQKAGQAGPWQVGIYDDALLPGLRDLCSVMKSGGTPVFAQLAHAGANANAGLTGLTPLAPTARENVRGELSKTMDDADIEQLTNDFAAAARRAKDAGFDGVQLHAAHGYLLSQFLSPFYNMRTDRYGGSVQNRVRLTVEIYRAVRAAVGEKFVVAMKINAEDFIEGGFSPGMMLETALILEREGVDAIEMSGGGVAFAKYRSSRQFDPKCPEEETYYRDTARHFKEKIKMPLMLVGGIRSIETAEALVAEGTADVIAFSRPLIREPQLVKRWLSGDKGRAKCISCDGCRQPAAQGEGLRCVLEQA